MKEIFNELTPQIAKKDYAYFDADTTTLIRNSYFKSNQELCAKRFPTQTSLFPSHDTNTDRHSHRSSPEILINNMTGFNYKPKLDDTLELTLKLIKFIHERQYQSQPTPPKRQQPLPILKRLRIKIKRTLTKVLRTNNSKQWNIKLLLSNFQKAIHCWSDCSSHWPPQRDRNGMVCGHGFNRTKTTFPHQIQATQSHFFANTRDWHTAFGWVYCCSWWVTWSTIRTSINSKKQSRATERSQGQRDLSFNSSVKILSPQS